ncbi:hypothetical protein KGQ19_21425 [Catenulispora sp. NL8]|uniref:Uncharacterized protein n=1 Tax=Catenulispora pinistramenti TaxID=2705254 RepID=A0ABS5KTP9_9ACTN|nr:hypothetical protein [Catenulispora pinistramenti]MBS2549428.1 hypothetical protein [Catenulispora pinistramenti]
MKISGSDSWEIRVTDFDWLLVPALWIRAAERIDVPVAGVVTAPLDIEEMPEPSADTGAASGAALTQGWLYLWNVAVLWPQLKDQKVLAEVARFAPPDFEALADFPEFRRVFAARWPQAHAWHSARKRAGIEALLDRADGAGRDVEGQVVRAVEAEIGRKSAPFSLHLIVLPVAEDLIRPAGEGTYLVPERFRRTDGYQRWLTTVVRELA